VLLLLPDVVLGGTRAFVIIIVDADNESKPIPIATNKNINMLSLEKYASLLAM
jgi:hypothetical protein